MKKNMGGLDKGLRVGVAAVIGLLLVTGNITGTLATLLAIVAVVMVGTSAIGFCPLYPLLGISTCKKGGACCGNKEACHGKDEEE